MMMLAIILSNAITTITILAIFLLFSYLAYNHWLSPLAKVPNAHWTSSFSYLWILWVRYHGRENVTLQRLHEQFGPLLRLGPSDLSVCGIDHGVHTVYQGAFEKHPYYARFRNYDGLPTLFTTLSNKEHGDRRRIVSRIFAQSYIQQCPDLLQLSKDLVFNRLLPIIESSTHPNSAIDIRDLSDATAVDFITAYLYGSAAGTNLLQDLNARTKFLDLHYTERSYGFWLQELPVLAMILQKIGIQLIPTRVRSAAKELEKWCLATCRAVELGAPTGIPSTKPIMYAHLSKHLISKSLPFSNDLQPNLSIVSELHDHTVAGYETTGQMLTKAIHALSLRPDIQTMLHAELMTLAPSVRPIFLGQYDDRDGQPSTDCIPSPSAFDSLPLLHAIVIETLRLRDRGPFPRVTPYTKDGVSIAGSPPLPGGIRVSTYSFVLHHNSTVYPNPYCWDPLRWLTRARPPGVSPERYGAMGKWFMAFGGGSRTCNGRDFALFQMKTVLSAIYTNYTTALADKAGLSWSGPWVQSMGTTKLMVKFERRDKEICRI